VQAKLRAAGDHADIVCEIVIANFPTSPEFAMPFPLPILSRLLNRREGLCRGATSVSARTYQLCRQKSISRQNPLAKLAALALLAALAISVREPFSKSADGAELNTLTPEQLAEGWINLFDGETLFGWQPTSDANWKVENGEIRVSAGNQGWLMTTSEFADYELHVEFKAPATTNSGVFLRTPLGPKDPAEDCIELNIAPRDNPFPTASLVGRAVINTTPQAKYRGNTLTGFERTGEVPSEIDVWDGKWHALDIVLRDDHAELLLDGKRLDGILLSSGADGTPVLTPTRGHIGLQFREGEVAFRNIRLRPLGLEPMLTGDRLEGWRTDETRDAKFALTNPSGSLPLEGRAGEGGEAGTNAELQVLGGPGELETNDSYGDFVLQLDCFVDGDALNSGVFFRSIPGEFANGYESQIHNAVKDNDPTKPVDAGTGAIYRRTTARRVVSKDHEWFTKTIIATGPHIAVWVNGYQVTDWTDDRPSDPNPRKGLSTEPGTISLQAHDPTTNLRFRNLRIAELPDSLDHDDTTSTTKDN
jgi:hypothetical protein